MLDEKWRERSFAGYDVVFHVAAIVHKNEKPNMKNSYYAINSDLPVSVATKAKEQGVKQFIFLSSMSVYGLESGMITLDTIPLPRSFYGKSKLKAEHELIKMQSEAFNVVILRPPMVYGKGCKGNYVTLSKIAKKSVCFPDIKNYRSMIYIDNLCEFVRLIINKGVGGLFFPQNKEYVNTTELVKTIAEVNGCKIRVTKLFNPGVFLMCKLIKKAKKAFGSLIYDIEMSNYPDFNYCLMDFKNTVRNTEGNLK